MKKNIDKTELTNLRALVEKIQKLSGKKVVFTEKDNKAYLDKLVKLLEAKTGKKVSFAEAKKTEVKKEAVKPTAKKAENKSVKKK